MDLKLKMIQNKAAFLVLLFLYIVGCIFYKSLFPDTSPAQILLYSIGLEIPPTSSTWSVLYQRMWEIFVELIFFGFIFSVLLENYNPIETSKVLASQQKNHCVVVGYKHLGNRIVDFLREQKKPYVLMEKDKNLTDELLKVGEPVVIGDYIDEENLKIASIEDAREIFICINKPRETIVIAEKVRKMNKDCRLYIRIFNDQFQSYLKSHPLNAYTFSTSGWAMESMTKWVDKRSGNVLVLGRDHLAQRITEYVGLKRKRKVHIMDEKLDEDLYDEPKYEKIDITKDNCDRLRYIQDHIDLTTISTLFICWKEEEEFSTSIYLVTQFYKKFPKIKIYCRIFDEELANIVNKLGAETFSTSEFAFKKLQENVNQKSLVYQVSKY